jgi:hypothetical protein
VKRVSITGRLLVSQSILKAASVVASSIFLSAPNPSWAAEQNLLRVGVAKLDVSPKDLTGLVGIPNKPFAGVSEPIYVRALVLNDGATTAAIVAIDFVEFGNTLPLRARIARELAIPADHIMIAASHDHSAPRGGPVTAGTSSATQGRPLSSAAYTKQADDTIVEALRKAKASMQPARIGVGTGQADVNVYRYAYTSARGWRAGVNPEGPSDKTVWVVKFENLAGEPIALLMNYAVHSNVMAGAGAQNDNKIIGDISGTAERYVESHYQDKLVALWTMGAAADQYPKFNFEMDKTWANTPAKELIDIQGKTLAMEVIQTAGRIAEMTATANIQASERIVACEMKAQPGQMLDMHLGLIRINGTAITGVSGEVATNIFAHLQKESPLRDTLMVTLSNDRVGYIPDEANWERMGAAFVRGCAESAIVKNLVEMMNSTMR